MKIPRTVIAATGSGVGKTTITVAIIAALRARGLKVASFKCGPDYLDPTYHARASGWPSPNLDTWMMGRAGALDAFASARAADIAIVEGMMGLFDSAAPDSDEGSTAELAKYLKAPVILVADAAGVARTISAIALGFAQFDPAVKLAGLICNQIGGRGHLELLREARPEVPIVGGFPKLSEVALPERHLGLFTANSSNFPDALIARLGALAEAWLDLDAILAEAHKAPDLEVAATPPRKRASAKCRIGIADDEAFHFYYESNLKLLEAAGAELVRFSPLHDGDLPEIDGLYLGGGYPEASARELSENRAMLEAIRGHARSGRPLYAECGGLMYITDGIRTLDGVVYPMVGLLPGVAVMKESLQALGYVEVVTRAPSMLGPAGSRWRGHQFRYSILEPAPPPEVTRMYEVTPRWGAERFDEGFCRGSVVASYVHSHWASNPEIATHFVASCTVK